MVSRNHKLWWQSSYDRGLDILLFLWPDIRVKFPSAELHVAYGWNLFDKVYSTNPERMKWKESVEALLAQDGIFHYGRVGQNELKKLRSKCGILAYPTYFPEINFIGALESQSDGLVPVTMNSFAMKETVGAGIKIDGDIRDLATQEEYLKALFKIMGDEQLWKQESIKAIEFSKNYTWDKISRKWVDIFNVSTPDKPFVSVVTPTIRSGFWDLMGESLSNQSYKDFEWVIVDDFKKDQTDIANRTANKYNLNIKYIRGDRVKGIYKKAHGLARANNIAWHNAGGTFLIWLQDFITIPENSIEDLVTLYLHNKDALIAPVDEKYELDGTWGKRTFKNVRLTYDGIRETENPFDFEMNFAGIPKRVIEDLNGWYEAFDEEVGYDNVEFAKRALDVGCRIIIDDSIICKAVNLPTMGGGGKEIYQRMIDEGWPLTRENDK